MQTLQIILLVGVAVILGLQIWRIFSAPPNANIRVSDHGSEVLLLAAVAVGCLLLLWRAIENNKLEGLDVAAFLLILQRVIEAVTNRWTARSIDTMGRNLANAPPSEPPSLPENALPAPPPKKPDEPKSQEDAIQAAIKDAIDNGVLANPPPPRPGKPSQETEILE